MKEFEKWYAEERKRRVGAPMYSADYRTGWQAALEMVLKSQNLHLKTMLIQEIKKELQE